MTLFYFLIFIFSCFTLSYSGTWIVKSLVKIARFLKWKSFVVASLLMGLSTSLPEIFVGITSAMHNESELILGVIIGSNIIALTLVVGIGALKDGLTLKRKTENLFLKRKSKKFLQSLILSSLILLQHWVPLLLML